MGIFVGIAAFTGGLMNLNYLMAGITNTNPLFFAAAILLVLAWKTASYYGLDRLRTPTARHALAA